MTNITGSGEIQEMPDEDDYLTGSTGDDTIIGSSGADTLVGKDGDDLLVGGDRYYDDIDNFYRYSDDNNSDLLVGGAGNDTYRIGNGDIVVETPGGGDDTVILDPANIYEGDPETDEAISLPHTYALAEHVENLTFVGSGTFNGTGNALDNVIEVFSEDETLDYVFHGTAVLDGGAGADTLIGGTGADTFIVDNPEDVAVDFYREDDADGDPDTVIAFSHYSLGGGIENLEFAGTGNFIGVGNSQSNLIIGGDGDDTLDGGGTSGWGDDTLIGGKGNDVYRMSDASDQVLIVENADEGVDTIETTSSSFDLSGADEIENLTFAGEGDFEGHGSDLDNVIRGGAGNDTLSGGIGVDTLVGGTGNDTYEIHLDDEQAATDALIEATNGGTDTVSLQGGTGGTTTYALADHFENLRYEGFRTFVGTGNSANNTIVGGFGDNILDGEAGADTLIGGSAGGSNTFIIDDADDLILGAYSRSDTALVSLNTYVLAEEQAIIWPFGIGMGSVERIAFAGSGSFKGTGNSASNEIVGGASDDSLMGLAGNDTLNGGAGADKMAGGLGNDTYLVDHAGDVAQENPLSGLHGGTDTIIATLKSYTLGRFSYIENLVGGDDGFTGTGNGLDNKITGGSGDDILDGKGGRDTLSGLAGNDTYIVDNDLDFVAEFTTIDDGLTQSDAGGTDLVKTTLDEYALTDFVENLTFIGSGSFTGIGNGLANQITGGSEANTLYGGLDNDKLFGGDGNDRLYGEDGDDFLYGGKGNDTLHGAAGEDIFVFNSAPNPFANKDFVKDFVVVDDTIWLSNAIFKTLGNDGALKSSAFFASNTGTAHDKDDRIIYDKDSGVLFYDADGSGKAAAVAFSMISKNLALTYKDFYVV